MGLLPPRDGGLLPDRAPQVLAELEAGGGPSLVGGTAAGPCRHLLGRQRERRRRPVLDPVEDGGAVLVRLVRQLAHLTEHLGRAGRAGLRGSPCPAADCAAPRRARPGRTIVPDSSIHTAMGTLVNPNRSSVTCAVSISEGCVGSATSMNGRASAGSMSRATVTTVRPRSSSSACSRCHTGSESRHPHQLAQATRSTLRPCSDDRRNGFPSRSSRTGSAAAALARAAPSGGRPERPEAVIGVVDERHPEALGDDLDVERPVVPDGAGSRDADLALAQPFRLGFPPGPRGELGRLGAERSEQHRQNVSGRQHN